MTGWKQWISGEVVEHTAFQTYLQDQVVQTYAGTAARSSALGTAVSEGMVSYLEDTNKIEVYDGSAWLEIATTAGTVAYATNAGTAVYATTSGTAVFSNTAGTASYATLAGTATFADQAGTATTISGSIAKTQVTGTAVTLGDTATVTNAMLAGSIENAKLVNSQITLNGTAVALGGSATISAGGFTNPMTTLGDLIVGGAAGVAERLGIGTAGQVLSTNGTVASWSTPTDGALPTQTGNAGELLVTNGTAASWSNTVTANSTTVPALIAKATGTYTANIQEWQPSASTTPLAFIRNNGEVVSTAAVVSDTATDGYSYLYGGQILADGETNFASVDVKAGSGASQSSFNLTNWRNSSNAIIASIGPTGLLTANPASPANANTAKAVGHVGMPQVLLASGGLTLNATHAGDHIYVTGTGQTITIPANSSVPFEIGTTIVIINAAAVTTTIAITSDTLLLAGAGTTGSRTLAAHGMATLVKITSTSWIISGNGLT